MDHTETVDPINLTEKFLFVGGGGGTSSFVVEDGPGIWRELMGGEMSDTAKRMVTEDGFLMTQGTVGVDSGSQWEIHPEGDEILTLLEGAVDVYFEQEDGSIRICPLRTPGTVCRVPPNTWHTSKLPPGETKEGKLNFFTFGRGTRHKVVE